MAEENSDPQSRDSQESPKVKQASQAPPIIQLCHPKTSECETTEEPTPISEQTPESSSSFHRGSPYPLRTREPKRQWDELPLCTSEDLEPYKPKNLRDAMSAPDAALWKEVVQDEYDSIINNKTWSLTKLAIKSCWIYKVKPGVNGCAPRYMARLVAKGYSRRPEIDYEETFAPVAKQTTLRVVLCFVAAAMKLLTNYQLFKRTF